MSGALHLDWNDASPASESMIAELEARLGVSLPEAYRRLVAVANGGTPKGLLTFECPHPRLGPIRSGFDLVLDVTPGLPDSLEERVAAHGGEGVLEAGLVPFGEDGGGDLMCFDYRACKAAPAVVYVAISARPSERVIPLAQDFDAFLSSLHIEI